MSSDPLFRLLSPDRLISVVDIGANPVDGAAPYQPLLDLAVCQLTGFEPLDAAREALESTKGDHENYLPYAVGDGKTHTLHVCRASGMTSLLKPDVRMLRQFNLFPDFGEVTSTRQVETKRLDDIDEISAIDFLKIDIQGSELTAFQSGRVKLNSCVVIQTEVSFQLLYEDQPTFCEVDSELKSQGFQLHAFQHIKRWGLAPLVVNENPRAGMNQLLEADAVYVRSLMFEHLLDSNQLKHLCLILHHCYESFDLALKCILELQDRGHLAPGSEVEYLRLLPVQAACHFPR